MKENTDLKCKQEIKEIKKLILDTVKLSNAGHITSSFSCVEILYSVYKHSNINKENVGDKLRDRVIISKEHCRLAQVCVLGYLGLLDKKYLEKYCIEGENLGHDIYNTVKPEFSAVDIASGSLGHGLSVGAGIAYANPNNNVYVIIGDGEMQEGSIYEAMLFIGHHKINNIITIIDNNGMQIDNYTKNILDTNANLENRLISLGFDVIKCEGHDTDALTNALNRSTDKPKCIIANTVKGKGIEFLLNEFSFAKFHHSGLNEREFEQVYEAVNNEQ